MRVKHRDTGGEGTVLAAEEFPEGSAVQTVGDHYRVRFDEPELTAWVPAGKLEVIR